MRVEKYDSVGGPATKLTLEDGKYELTLCQNGAFTAKRYGEPWRDMTGDKMILAMFDALTQLLSAEAQAQGGGGVDELAAIYDAAFNKCDNDPDDRVSPKWRALSAVRNALLQPSAAQQTATQQTDGEPVGEIVPTYEPICSVVSMYASGLPVGTKLYTAPPSTPVGVEELAAEWEAAYRAFKGAFDTPLSRKRQDDEYAEDARARLAAINEKICTIAQQPAADAERAFFAQDFYEEAREGKKPWPAQEPAAEFLKNQPCGCVLCTCEDERQCQGCGAKHCGNRTNHPAYVAEDPPRFQFTYDVYRRGPLKVDDLIDYAVIDEGASTERGELEALRAELDKLRSIVGFMARSLSSSHQRELAKMLGVEEVR